MMPPNHQRWEPATRKDSQISAIASSQTRIDALVSRDDFLLEPGIAHLCAGGETPILRSHTAAVERFFADKSQGQAGRMTGLMGLLERTRARAGALLGVPADD